MTRLTALLLTGDDPDRCVTSYGPLDGGFGIYIGTMNYSPSGSPRPRALITSKPVYPSADAAQQAAELVVREAQLFLIVDTPQSQEDETK